MFNFKIVTSKNSTENACLPKSMSQLFNNVTCTEGIMLIFIAFIITLQNNYFYSMPETMLKIMFSIYRIMIIIIFMHLYIDTIRKVQIKRNNFYMNQF